MSAHISWISIAPVKGLALIQLDEARLETYGVRENRRFHLISEDGRLLNGKPYGSAVQIRTEYDDAAGVLALHFPGGRTVTGEVSLGDPVTTVFYGRPVEGHLVTGPWTEALSDWAGATLRLVRPDEPGAGVDRGEGGAVSLVSIASLDALADAAGEEEVDARRFRMLLGIDGIGPHEEDAWLGRRVSVGEAVVVPRGNVGRCVVTTQNPETGHRDLDTLRVLKAYRGELETTEPLPFGVWGEVVEPGLVRVGDPVAVV
jgi:MOSC domain-containing protein